MSQKFFSRDKLLGERTIVAYFVTAKLIICLFPLEYGYFRDELYYIALSDNLDFGYVDVPPLVPFLLAIVRTVLGTSFFALHLLPAISGALVVWLVSRMVKQLGGGFNAMLLALTCVTLAPIYLAWESTYSYDVFDKLNWTLMLYVMVLILKTEERKYWIYFGLVAGFALMTKITILFVAFGLLSAIILTKDRRHFSSWQFWAGGFLALLIFCPYIIWQIKEGLPAIEYYRSYASAKTWPSTPPEFIKNQILTMNLLAFPVWLSGIYYFLFNESRVRTRLTYRESCPNMRKGGLKSSCDAGVFNESGRRYRVFGYAYLIVLIMCIVLKVKFFLPAPFYTVLFAGGAVSIEKYADKRGARWLRRSPAVAIFLTGLLQVPFARPILPVELFVKYTGRSIWEGIKGERHDLGRLPQHYHDRFGWDIMAKEVASAYNGLNERDRAKACVLMGNYGEAGAIWVYGQQYGLGKPVSGHLQYYLWGPRGHSGEVVISMGIDVEILKDHFGSVEKVGAHWCRWAIPYERLLDVYVCREPKETLAEMWPSFKHLD